MQKLVEAMKNSKEIDSLVFGLDFNMPYNGTPLGFHVIHAPVSERYGYLGLTCPFINFG